MAGSFAVLNLCEHQEVWTAGAREGGGVGCVWWERGDAKREEGCEGEGEGMQSGREHAREGPCAPVREGVRTVRLWWRGGGVTPTQTPRARSSLCPLAADQARVAQAWLSATLSDGARAGVWQRKLPPLTSLQPGFPAFDPLPPSSRHCPLFRLHDMNLTCTPPRALRNACRLWVERAGSEGSDARP
eukprot:2488066-Rhodomonas_salina.2